MTTTDPTTTPVVATRHDRASSAAADLLRTALLAKLAVDLEDPTLSRRAARYAVGAARLLAGLDFAGSTDPDDDRNDDLPEVDDLLERLPSRRDVVEEDEA